MSFLRVLQCLCYISVIGLVSSKLRRGFYPNLIDFCANDEVYVGIPWNCHGYLHCRNANGLKMPFWQDCPASLYFNFGSKTCTWPQNVSQPCPGTADVVMAFCPDYPAVQVLHPTQCAQYYDCSNMVNLPNQPAYLNECPYPKLFNADTLRCDDYASVDCGDRIEPLSPCDYVRHQCSGQGCTPCTDLIPGCEDVPNGPTSYQGRLLTKFYLQCLNNKTQSIEICRDGVFDPVLGRCTREVDSRAVDILCTTNPNARMEHPGDCSKYFDCRDRKQMIKECPYPKLYSLTKQACLDFNEVQCNGRREPKAPCDYKAYECTGINCPVCELENPSCEGLPDGKNAFLGREQTPWYIECRGERTINKLTCPGGNNFDTVERRCLGEQGVASTLFPEKPPYDPEEVARQAINGIPPIYNVGGGTQRLPPPNIGNRASKMTPVNPVNSMNPMNPPNARNPVNMMTPGSSQMHDMCVGNEGLLLADPNNCARYFNCSRYAVKYEGFALSQDECPYPQLFSIETGFCEDFPDVNCKDRFIPKAPCDYLKNRCKPGNVSCVPCAERWPSCVGRENGNNTIPGRDMTDSYVICLEGRTVSLEQCPVGFFDPVQRKCRTKIGAAAIRAYCTAHPGEIKANPVNCAQYFDCGEESIKASTFLRECPYPQEFDDKTSTCVNFTMVDCGKRREYTSPCDYLQNRCPPSNPTCKPCSERHFDCSNLSDGLHPASRGSASSSYIVCFQGRTIATEGCKQGVFDPVERRCALV
uniref:Uncharacterized protein LOC111132108 n=1 Tax=Crassostrea virginica TaxID=6565 RepID=A0A8B8E4K4_CRAVI|nr:uncharacterized protein LOC111132108 [Crassostrea virginica]